MRTPLCAALCLALVALLPPAARAQSDAPVGVRAAGMGGAFVAVADDASAVYWNPAGLASGSVRQHGDRSQPDEHRRRRGVSAGGLRTARRVGTPAAGSTPTTERSADASRRGRDRPRRRWRTWLPITSASTLVQSIGDVVAVGATLKYGRGSCCRDEDPHGLGLDRSTTLTGEGLEQVRRRPGRDGDARRIQGGPVRAKSVRAIVRNCRRWKCDRPPAPGARRRVVSGHSSPAGRCRLGSHAGRRRRRPVARCGYRRRSALSRWTCAPRGFPLEYRGRYSRRGPVGSVGVSYPVYRSILADAQASFGSRNGDRGWGVGARVLF